MLSLTSDEALKSESIINRVEACTYDLHMSGCGLMNVDIKAEWTHSYHRSCLDSAWSLLCLGSAGQAYACMLSSHGGKLQGKNALELQPRIMNYVWFLCRFKAFHQQYKCFPMGDYRLIQLLVAGVEKRDWTIHTLTQETLINPQWMYRLITCSLWLSGSNSYRRLFVGPCWATYSSAQWLAYSHPWWGLWWIYSSAPALFHDIWDALWSPDCPKKSHWTPKWGVPLYLNEKVAFQTL